MPLLPSNVKTITPPIYNYWWKCRESNPSPSEIPQTAKISMLNISGISRNIQFKAIFKLSELFLAPYPVATPSRVLKRLRSPYFRP